MSAHRNVSEVTNAVRAAYVTVKRVDRVVADSDRLFDDLDVDSLDAIEMVTVLEELLGEPVLDDLEGALDRIVTVGDLITAIAAGRDER